MRLRTYINMLTKPELDEIIAKANFTEEEKDIFIFLSQRKTNTEISMKLSLSERTINRRIICIKSKMLKLEEQKW